LIALSFRGVSKVFPQATGSGLRALNEVTFDLPAGRSLAIVGRSGSGKSTLLHLAAGIELPSAGAIRVFDRDWASLDDGARSRARRDTIGLVFQFFYLLPHLSVLDNVLLPAWIAGDDRHPARSRGRDLLARVGLLERQGERTEKLSGGEMQRVALCRALLRKPKLLLADEPTGNLDDDTAKLVMDLLLALTAEESGSLVYVTHSVEMAARADGIRRLHSGVLEPATAPA
jgi:predicted ABC-type transport system involved in lysophospholipase L1 biosynthesis ATPase subunit